MFPTIHLQKMAALLSLAFMIATGSLVHAAPPPYQIANLTMTAQGTGAQPINTFSVTITFPSPPVSTPVSEVHFGAYQSSDGTLTSLLVQKPTIVPGSVSAGWESAVSGDPTTNYRLKFTPVGAAPGSLSFQFQSADTITTLRTISTSTAIAKADYPIWVTNAAVISGASGSPTYTNIFVVPPLPMTFTNTNANLTAWVTFETSKTSSFSASYVNSAGVVTNIGINNPSPSGAIFSTPISVVKSRTIYLTSIDSGVAYVFLGANPAKSLGTVPSAVDSPLLWSAACEITYVGAPADSGDLTVINCFSFPMSATVTTTSNDGSQFAGFEDSVTSDDIINSLVTGMPQTNPPVPPLTTRQDLVTINAPAVPPAPASVLRILTPGQLPNPNLNDQFSICGYASFEPYVQSLVGKPATMITGYDTDASGTNYQYVYTLTAAPDPTNNSIPSIYLNGYYVPAGGPASQQVKCNFVLPGDDIANDNYPLSWFLYGSPDNLSFPQCPMHSAQGFRDPGTLDQDVLAQILHDMEAGFNLGFIGSPTVDTISGKQFGMESSMDWFADTQKMDPDNVPTYSALQPSHPYYNPYSALISDISGRSIYGSAYSDAVPGVTLDAVAITTSPTTTVAVTGWDLSVGAPSTDDPSLAQSINFPAGYSETPAPGTFIDLPYYSQTVPAKGGQPVQTTIPIQWTVYQSTTPAPATLTQHGAQTNTTGWRLTFNNDGQGTLVGTAGGTLAYQPAPEIKKGFNVQPPPPVIILKPINNPQTYHLSGSWTYQIEATLTNAPKGAVITYTLSGQMPGPNGPNGSSVGTVATLSPTVPGQLIFTQTGSFTVSLSYQPTDGPKAFAQQGVSVVAYKVPGPHSITFGTIPTQTAGVPYTMAPTLQGLPQDAVITYTINSAPSGAAASFTGNVLKCNKAGKVVFTANYAGTNASSNVFYPGAAGDGTVNFQ